MQLICNLHYYLNVQVFWKRLYKTTSGMDKGTLCQLRNLINRRNVTKSPKSNVNASEDFLEVIVNGHILAAVMSYLDMSSMDDLPLPSVVSHDIWMEDDEVRRSVLHNIAEHIVTQHVDLATTFNDPSHNDENKGTAYEYACEVLTLGLLVFDFKDAVREGDGDQMLLIWKYLLLLFKATGRKNYAIEALTLLSQYHILLPRNLAEQLKWSRFVNVHGLPGHNVSCDLHMEHLNRLVKVSIENLGANKSEKAIKRVAKAMGTLSKATKSFDSEVGISSISGKHSEKSQLRDLKTVTQQLIECDPFKYGTLKSLRSFPHLQRNVFKTLKEKEVKEWMVDRFSMISQPALASFNLTHEDSDCSEDEQDTC